TTPNNAKVLRRHDLQDLTEKQLFQLLLQNDPYLLPEICSHYNKGSGLQGSCRFNSSSTKLHMCQHYYQCDCQFGSACKRAHRLDAQAMKLFQGYSQENINNLHKNYRNKLIISASQPRRHPVRLPTLTREMKSASSSSGESACTKVLLGKKNQSIQHQSPEYVLILPFIYLFIYLFCLDKCARVHWHLPYRWQVLDVDGVTYKDLVDMENIERAYCDPARGTSCMDQPSASLGLLRFMGFQRCTKTEKTYERNLPEGIPVRRLSTTSSVSKPPHFILTTQWVWYWKDDGGAWLEFGQVRRHDCVWNTIALRITCRQLECTACC
uniref:Poly (ADP-ribose) polymerase family, member 12a n=1 Tax=Salarias fasciatus TaxID=181472 RepID=A0A672F8D1_SALFA